MKYYYLVSYLPPIRRDDKKLKIRFSDFLAERAHIAREDWSQVELILLIRDIFLLEKLLQGKEVSLEHTLYGRAFWKEQIKSPKEIPTFLEDVFQDVLSGDVGPKEVDRLYAAYYNLAIKIATNPLLRDYLQFEKDLRNITAAIRARRMGLSPSDHIVGEGDVVESLSRSSAEDFGLGRDRPWMDRLLEADDPLHMEDCVERILWDYIDERMEQNHFEFDVVIGYLLKLLILEKRLALNEEKGMEIVRQLEEI
jgi:hypothetical protein